MNRTRRGPQAVRSRTCLALGLALVSSLGLAATPIVTQHVDNLTGQTQASVPVTFGQVFKAGDVPQGSILTATLNGTPVQLQTDIKASNPDKSVRFAVLTAWIPSLGAGQAQPLVIATGGVPYQAAGAAVTLGEVLGSGYDAKATLAVHGVDYVADARNALTVASLDGSCTSMGAECNAWLDGPLAGAWIVSAAPVNSQGQALDNLRVYFAVRAYAQAGGNGLAHIRTDIVVENSNAYAAQTQPQYTATLTSGSASYTSPALTQYDYTRWHHVLWWNDAAPQVYVQQDTRYIQDTGAISYYASLTPDATFLGKIRQYCAPLDHCDQTNHMGNTGAQPAIGPLPRWASVYVVDPEVRTYNYMLANADALGAYSIHYRDAATGFPLSIVKHPYATQVEWAYANEVAKGTTATGKAYAADLLPNCVNNSVVTTCTNSWYGTGNLWLWDNAHQPSEAFLPYLVTGDWYYMSELAFGASQNDFWSNPYYRGYSAGLVAKSHSQIRGQAWTLRNLADAAWGLPDDYPLKGELGQVIANNIAYYNTTYTNDSSIPLWGDGVPYTAVTYSENGGKDNAMAPWQHNFLTWAAGHLARLGYAGASDWQKWLAKYEVGTMNDWASNPEHGYCWLEASAYTVDLKDAAGNWLNSFTQIYDTTFPTLDGLACNSPAMVTAMGVLKGQAWSRNEMSGYPYSSTGYPANFQIGLSSAVDSGIDGAAGAWSLFQTRQPQPQGSTAYNDYPNFDTIPASIAAGQTPAPPTTPPLQPPPVTNPPPGGTTPPPTNPPPPPTCDTYSVDPDCGGTVRPISHHPGHPVEPPGQAKKAGSASTAHSVTPTGLARRPARAGLALAATRVVRVASGAAAKVRQQAAATPAATAGAWAWIEAILHPSRDSNATRR